VSDDCGCEDLISRLFQLLDAELEDSERARLQRHIDACPTCHEAADAEQHLRHLIRRSCAELAPETLRARVITQITVLRAQGFVARDVQF